MSPPSKSFKGKAASTSSAGHPTTSSSALDATATPTARKPKNRPAILKSGNSQASNKPVLEPGQEPPPPPLFPVGYKTPISLLNERCQKSSFGKPAIASKQLASGLWTATVTLHRSHPNTKDHESVYMRPPPPPSPIAIEKPTALEARHWGALYALFRFSNHLRLNIQLPPTTRDYWAALEHEKKQSDKYKDWYWSTTPFEAQAEREKEAASRQGASGAERGSGAGAAGVAHGGAHASGSTSSSSHSKPAVLSKAWTSAPEVKMPSTLRDLVEETIRSLMPSNSSNNASGAATPLGSTQDHSDDEDGQDPRNAVPLPTVEEQAAADELVQLGFRKGYVSTALAYVLRARHQVSNASSDPLLKSLASQPFKSALLSYLHLHVSEDDLPASFRSSKPADSNARIATSHGSDALGKLWKAQALAKDVGIPVPMAEKLLEECSGEEGKVVELLTRKLNGWGQAFEIDEDDEIDLEQVARLSDDHVKQGWTWPLTADERKELQDRRKAELMGLEGIFGDRFRKTDLGCEILVSSLKPRRQAAAPKEQVILRILFHPASFYPSPSADPGTSSPYLPTFYVYSSTLPAFIRLYLTSLIAQQFVVEPHGAEWRDLAHAGYGGVVAEMATFLQENWDRAVDHPPDSRMVLSKLLGSARSMRPGQATPRADKSNKSLNFFRGRGPSSFFVSPAQQAELVRYWTGTMQKPAYADMMAVRSKLPAFDMKHRIVDLVSSNRVVIVSGETGSGKTTQVPSFILDDAIAKGQAGSINIIVTQPRRISAIGVATRVAAERLEDINDVSSRKLIGYAIRGERKASKDCRMIFCTTGVVLARLSRGGDADLAEISHIFIDEVHERSVDSDFLLLELRDLLKRNLKIKVVLMSATINQKQFSDYYGGAPCIEIPGFTHPVQDHYLEDIVPHLRKFSPAGKPTRKATQAQLDRMRESFISQGVENERHLSMLETLTRSERIDFGLVGATVAYCLEQSRDVGGDVLVFMTGVLEIKNAVKAIESAISSSDRVEVFHLHANLTSAEQTSVFRKTKADHRKVVVATNVAETSITIDGIVYVVDSGRVKENQFDPDTSVTKLVEVWTSKASSKQRRGRAGRTRPGQCFKLFSHYTEETAMANHPTPEMVRIPLESLCLQIKAMRADEDVTTFLAKALNPPDVRAIDSAGATLLLLGAIEEGGGTKSRLTPLGMHLAMLPLDLRLGKMLVLAAIFKCLDPILTVAAFLSSKSLFNVPFEKRDEAQKARSMYYTGRSDLLSDIKGFEGCIAARNDGGHAGLRAYAENVGKSPLARAQTCEANAAFSVTSSLQNFISLATFRDVLQLRTEYLHALSDVGFIPFRTQASNESLNTNAKNENLLKAIIFAGTARLVKVKLPPALFDKGASGAIERDRESKEVKYFERDGRVFLHPGSLLFTETRFSSPFVTYFAKHVTTKPFLRDVTEVPLYGVLLFGERVNVELDKGVTVGTDGWVMMRAWPRIGVLVNSLRRLFDADLEAMIESPPDLEGGASPAVDAMLALLERDGGLY
ncbi:BQ2448_6688 [Microbotryum intermedium]|uniref:RNA helicase n=1 Tax=Microbotryum intermedium TaxID=269621 RepID=A0A238FT24_9BASI|nr:BQ2448_6688 [Microbotryum intermedium]